jgi:hypothetical protein
MYGNCLFEVSGEFALSVVSDFDFAFFAWHNRGLRVRRNRATTTGNSLIDNQWRITGICESESAFLLGNVLGECPEIVSQLIELNVSLFLLGGSKCNAEKQHH